VTVHVVDGAEVGDVHVVLGDVPSTGAVEGVLGVGREEDDDVEGRGERKYGFP
jgi:hypothetical protein